MHITRSPQRTLQCTLPQQRAYTLSLLLLALSLSACGGDELTPSSPEAGAEMSAGIEAGLEAGAEMNAGTDAGFEAGSEAGSEAGAEMGGVMEEHPTYAVQMLELVNRFRAEGGACGDQTLPAVPPLTLNATLDLAALLHAQDMAEQGYFEHVSLDGREPWDRMQDVGYSGRAFGENIAAGHASAGATFDQWRNSPGHCVNMLSPNFSELGVGYYAYQDSEYVHYWVQNFGSP